MKHTYILCLVSGLIAFSCGKNRDVSSADGPNFREIHEDIHFHFDEIAIDGNEYLILERDRNHPHEGFGFMALKGTDMKKNQDSIKAYLKTLLELQTLLLEHQDIIQDHKYTEELFKHNL